MRFIELVLRFLMRERRRPAFEYLAEALVEEKRLRLSYYVLTDAVWENEDTYDRRCSLYNRLARANGFGTLDDHTLLQSSTPESPGRQSTSLL